MLVEIIDRAGRLLGRFADCALCERCVHLRELVLFRGPGQELPACRPCVAEFESWCEGRGTVETEEVAA
jgi:hypothetical protein